MAGQKNIVDVSVVAANFNNAFYLADFLDSINQSTVLPKELIFIDDGSTDNSLQIIDKYRNLPYLKVIRFEKNRGFCHALNAGIKSATGKYIARIDPDDIMQKNRIEIQYNFLEKNNDIDVVGSNVVYFDGKTGEEMLISNFPLTHKKIKKEYYKGDHGVQHPSVMIRRSVMKQYRYNQENVLAEDYELFATMIRNGHKFANIKEPLTKMRIHLKSAGSNIKYETIKKTFQLRDKIFGTTTGSLKIRLYYWYMLNYRKYLITENSLLKPFYLGAAILSHPQKLIKRLY